MAVGDREIFRRLRNAMLTGAAVSALLIGTAAGALAQTAGGIPEGAKLLLSSDELVYNRDNETVVANGGVQINYGGYQLVAKRVEYNQKTGRLMAVGNIEFIEPDGNRIYGDTMDITDDFADGFVNALRVETTDNTRLAAESAERVSGNEMILNNGVYTACLPCAENPARAPLWQIKAKRVIQNGKTQTVRLEKARFELLGMPIAYFPFLELPDHTVKRKSGFLFPTFGTSQNTGFSVRTPYFYVIAPDKDVTLSPSYSTSQGFLLEAEYRQRFENGTVMLKAAGINQENPGNFTAGTSDADVDGRAMVQTTGAFQINPRWSFGWDLMVQTDNNFSRTYNLAGADASVHTNTVYLTGLGRRNYFDLRSFYYDVQDADITSASEERQARVLPSFDYQYVAPEPIAGGELTANLNVTALHRSQADVVAASFNDRFRGLPGGVVRTTAEAEWKRTFTAAGGLLVTPLLAVRGDAIGSDMTAPNFVNPALYNYPGSFANDDLVSRGMVTAGLEVRYPWLISTETSSHVFEPIAQIFVRPDEAYAGGLPNEDAQSFVFDATTLFERDKFSGYDRIEGGTRANLGLRYTGSFDSGYTLSGVAGQSYHLAGLNSFATDDLVAAGANSGLETDVSDYVAMASLGTPIGIDFTGTIRLDKDDFSPERTGTTVSYSNSRLSTSLTYSHISAQPLYGSETNSDEVQSTASIRLDENWSIFGSAAYDINNDVLSRRSAGFSYEDECMIFSIVYSDKRDVSNESAVDWTLGARLSFRTLGDIQIGGE